MIDLNTVYNKCHLELMADMPEESIELTVTSPPYDGLREYEGYCFDFKKCAEGLYKVTKKGGVVVWVVGDETKEGSETGTSFRQALYFMEIGFKLHDTMIYEKLNPPPNSGKRYQQTFEYMFVFVKGSGGPMVANILKRKRRNSNNDTRVYRKKNFLRGKDGEFKKAKYFVKEEVPRGNIFSYMVGGGNSTKDKIAFNHPAIFPEALAADHVKSWTKEGDLVFDPMSGSGTVPVVCEKLKRKWIACEVSKKYCKYSELRISKHSNTLF